jgi:tight adherence protein C
MRSSIAMADFATYLIPALAFASVAMIVFVFGQQYVTWSRINRRLPALPQADDIAADHPFQRLHAIITRRFDGRRFGVDGPVRDKLRRELLQAGFFKSYAVNYYIFARIAAVLVGPTAISLLTELAPVDVPAAAKIALVSLTALIAIAAPDAYLSRRRRLLQLRYRQIFPDFIDLLVICIEAGLSLEAGFDRVRGEIFKQSVALGTNLEIMGAEMRGGRSTIEALESFSDRLGLDEAGAFVTMLRQSLELGSDIGDALRVFSDEIREKRLLRAEEAANKLSVKMVLPLGLFIFPVVLLVVMLPVVIKLLAVLR